MHIIAPDMDGYSWPDVDGAAVDESLCFHSCRYREALCNFDMRNYEKIPSVVRQLERIYSSTKVVYDGWPKNFKKFVMSRVDWNSSPGWPWKKNYPTNRDLFGFDGIDVQEDRMVMFESAVKQRWIDLINRPVSDPIFVFIKQEPHKQSKVDKKSWRLISGVGLTDTMIDAILYGNWLDSMIAKHREIPSKAGWAPSGGGFAWLAKSFRDKTPISIDKSSWDWTVGPWHIMLLEKLLPRMIFGKDEEWCSVFKNRFFSCFGAGGPVFKPSCGCEFNQLVDGIMKSGMLGTIGFNSIWQVAIHLAAGGSEDDLIFSLGDDTVQEKPRDVSTYIQNLTGLGCIIKEYDLGFPIIFGGHVITENSCVPAYRAKHMYLLKYLEENVGVETLDSYRHLYALDSEVSIFLEKLMLRKYGPSDMLSQEYLREWYLAMD